MIISRCNNKYAETHGLCRTATYRSWSHAKNRCTNDKNDAYHIYGGRGINICNKWLSFEGFYEDMGERPENTTLDRINVNDDYKKDNCRWATRTQQQRNRRDAQLILFNGVYLSIHDVAEKFNMRMETLKHRIFKMKMNVSDAVCLPIRKYTSKAKI